MKGRVRERLDSRKGQITKNLEGQTREFEFCSIYNRKPLGRFLKRKKYDMM